VSPAKIQQFNQAHDCIASSVLAPGRLFDLTSQKWTEVANLSISCSTWSRDGQYLYFQTLNVKDPAVYRLAVKNQTTERLFSINIRLADAPLPWWSGLGPDGSVFLLRDQTTEEIYALDSEFP
jgi:hypothetical protein